MLCLFVVIVVYLRYKQRINTHKQQDDVFYNQFCVK